MPRRLLQRSQHLLIWLGALPVLLAISAYLTSARHLDSVRMAEDTGLFLRQMDALLSSVNEAETGQRGYLLTGSEQYLTPYKRGRAVIERQLSELIQVAHRRGIPDSDLKRMQSLVDLKLRELDQTVQLYSRGDRRAAIAELQTNRGQLYMTQLRDLFAGLTAGQERLLAQAREEQQRRQQSLEAVLVAGMLSGIVLAILAYRMNRGYAQERDTVEEHIRQTVIERTADLEAQTKELENRTAELQRSNADLIQFTYVSSHDLQEPLRTVASYVGLLARRYTGQLDDTAQTYIRYAIDGAARMQALINDLLLYSRAGTQELKVERVPLDRVLDAALANLGAAISETETVIHRSPLPVVLADERKLAQVFQNLVANAVKFRKPGTRPEIRIEALRNDRLWTVSIQDNGIGFDPKYTTKIFEVFQRLHGGGQYQGNGIGLAICRRIIEHHCGTLSATSRLGEGSIFFFTLPEPDELTLRNFAR